MADWIGQTIGNYRIEALLGSGGMGQVYRARHIHLERAVALKVLHSDFAQNESFVQRFRQEARAAAALRHPNIVEVYDFGEQDSICYLAMELVTGGALRGLLRRRTEADNKEWNLFLGLTLVREAARALHFAHQHGVVHRDVKPDNILLLPQANVALAYSARLSDFGLARLAESGNLTATGTTMGTPAYISPEQCQGAEVDGRSDLYSLGIVLYEVATGLLPFAVKTLSDAVYKHVHTAPPPPRSVAPSISPELEAVILRCIAKSPADRFATGADLDIALGRVPELRPGDEKDTVAGKMPSSSSGVQTEAAAVNAATGNAPPLVSVLGSSLLPRVQMLDAQGQQLGVQELGGDGLTIGRLPTNNIVLDGGEVSRHHLRLDWDGSAVSITDLGSSNGSFLSGRRLVPQTPERWNAQDALQIGAFFLRLIPPISAGIAAGAAVAASTPSGSGATGGIGVAPENEHLTLTPGKPEALRITVANLGSQVEHLEVEVEGVPESWVKKPPKPTQLNPGMQATIPLGVEPPRTPQSKVGEYPVTVRVRSRETPDHCGEASSSWTVLPFDGAAVTMTPLRNGGMTEAKYTLNVRNEGNADARYDLKAIDDEQALTYDFDQPQLSLAPGATSAVHLTVQADRRWIGTPQPLPFTVQVRSTGDAANGAAPVALTQSGQFVHRAFLPPWAPPVALAVLAAIPFAWKTLAAKQDTIKGDPVVIVTPSPTISPTDVPTDESTDTPTDDDSLKKNGGKASPSAKPTSEPTPEPTLAPTPTPTPRPDRSADTADVQLVALNRLKFIRDQIQRTRAILDLVKDVPEQRAPRIRRYGQLPIQNVPQLSDAEKTTLSDKAVVRTITRRRFIPITRLATMPTPLMSPLPSMSPIPVMTPPPPEMSPQQVASTRLTDLSLKLSQTWGAIVAMGLGNNPSGALFNVDSAGTMKAAPENMLDFGVPRFGALGMKDLYSRLLVDLYVPENDKGKRVEEFGLVVKPYTNPDQYPLAPLYPHIVIYGTNPASIGTPEYKDDMQQIEKWLNQVEQDVDNADSHFH